MLENQNASFFKLIIPHSCFLHFILIPFSSNPIISWKFKINCFLITTTKKFKNQNKKIQNFIPFIHSKDEQWWQYTAKTPHHLDYR
jgi:hypothetical protein